MLIVKDKTVLCLIPPNSRVNEAVENNGEQR